MVLLHANLCTSCSQDTPTNSFLTGVTDGDGEDTRWTAHRVELALWSHHLAKKLKPELLEGGRETLSTGRKRTSEHGEESPKTKKSKQ